MNSEKYEIRYRDLQAPGTLRDLIAHLNHIRRENAALQSGRTLHFHDSDHPSLNLDVLGLDASSTFQAQDLLDGATYYWHGSRNFVELSPESKPAHILRLRL